MSTNRYYIIRKSVNNDLTELESLTVTPNGLIFEGFNTMLEATLFDEDEITAICQVTNLVGCTILQEAIVAPDDLTDLASNVLPEEILNVLGVEAA